MGFRVKGIGFLFRSPQPLAMLQYYIRLLLSLFVVPLWPLQLLASRLTSEVRSGAAAAAAEGEREEKEEEKEDKPGSKSANRPQHGGEPLLSCFFGDSWPEGLGPKRNSSSSSSRKSSERRDNGEGCGIASPRPGIWVTRAVQKETDSAVQRILDASKEMRKKSEGRIYPVSLPKTFVEFSEQEISSEEEVSETSTDSDTAEEVHKFPWMRRKQQQQQQQQQQAGKQKHSRQGDSRKHDTDSSPSSSPRHSPVRGAAGAANADIPFGAKATNSRKAAPARTAESAEASDRFSSVICLDGSSDGDSSVVEVQPPHPAKEANRKKRKKRKHRQAQQREKLRKSEKEAVEVSKWARTH